MAVQLITFPQCCGADESCSTQKTPLPRHGHVAVRVLNSIVLFGGEDEKHYTCTKISEMNNAFGGYHVHKRWAIEMNAIWVYDLSTDQWEKLVCSQGDYERPRPLAGMVAVVIGTDVYVHGGNTLRYLRKCTADLYKLSFIRKTVKWNRIPFGNRWLVFDHKIPSPRTNHTGWEFDDKLYIFGGFGEPVNKYLHDSDEVHAYGDNNNDERYMLHNQMCCFNPQEKKWTVVKSTGDKPSARKGHAMTNIHKTIWLYGGEDHDTIYDDLYTLDMDTLTWSKMEAWGTPRNPNPHTFHTLTAISDDKIILYGRNDELSPWLLDTASLSWHQYPRFHFNELEVEERQNHTATMGLESVIIFGGKNWNSRGQVNAVSTNIFSINMVQLSIRPKTMKKLALEGAYEHRQHVAQEWKVLPRHLKNQLLSMCHWYQDAKIIEDVNKTDNNTDSNSENDDSNSKSGNCSSKNDNSSNKNDDSSSKNDGSNHSDEINNTDNKPNGSSETNTDNAIKSSDPSNSLGNNPSNNPDNNPGYHTGNSNDINAGNDTLNTQDCNDDEDSDETAQVEAESRKLGGICGRIYNYWVALTNFLRSICHSFMCM